MTGGFLKYMLGHRSYSQPTLSPNANPVMNDALGWKSAVKKSTIHFHIDRTVGGFFFPNASVV